MKKIWKSMLATLCLGACFGAYAMGGTVVASAAYEYLYYESMEELLAPPACYLHLEEEKIKNMTDWGYYNVDGDDVWYFYGDGSAGYEKNPEIRFVTEGTDTTKKINGSYTFAPVEVEEFSFSYRIANDGEQGVIDLATHNYIVQILASDGTYPILTPTVHSDGNWHTITISQNTLVSNANTAITYGDVDHLFSGFIFKMGGLEGELMIKDIVLWIDGEEYTGETPEELPPEESSEEASSEESSEIISEESSSVEAGSSQESSQQTSEQPSSTASIPTSEEISDMIASEVEEEIKNAVEEFLSSCSSSIGGSFVVGAMALAGAVLLKKKEDR